ncbi:hypothetical protein EXIGLDRAFT_843424 [Exidia glandulosa HHB12029]|uniref:F-box domain-containing protein n=1 Tax=Exidia glandulosa HHB12029 TaxID=1314781 RepID=A0A165CN80_EXIGL|nr:hypothetical protein EXIGLDRAFT_843424 [Exidia glandulosa HHB12029]
MAARAKYDARHRPEAVASLVLHRCHDRLVLSAFKCLSQVSSNWRETALDHPVYWRDVCIRSTTTASLSLARHRLEAGRHRPWILTLELPSAEGTIALTKLLRPAIPFVKGITVYVNVRDVTTDLWSIFHVPVPELERFDVFASVQTDQSLPSLPQDLFSGVAPRLRDVTLQDVALPEGAVDAFSLVTSATLRSPPSAWERFPYQLFTIFPRIQSLTMAGGCVDFCGPIPKAVERGFGSLQFLDIDFYAGEALKFMQSLPVQRIPQMLVAFPDDYTALAALQHLQCQQYEVVILSTCYPEFRINFRHGQWNGDDRYAPFRMFAEHVDDYTSDDPQLNILFKQPELSRRVLSLLLATSLWPTIAPLMQPLPAVTSLTVIIDNAQDMRAQMPLQPLPCPALQVLRLESLGGFVRALANDVVALVPRIRTSHRLKLELEDVAVDDPTSILPLHFISVQSVTN